MLSIWYFYCFGGISCHKKIINQAQSVALRLLYTYLELLSLAYDLSKADMMNTLRQQKIVKEIYA
jgi:hypothetical protein